MKRLTLLTLALAGGAAFAAPKADVAKGKQIAQKVCAACHAADGNSGISNLSQTFRPACPLSRGADRRD